MPRVTCKRCLIDEIDANELARVLQERLLGIPDHERVSENEYRRRLDICERCGHINGGVCGMCGCFVELRAARSNKHCAINEKVW